MNGECLYPGCTSDNRIIRRGLCSNHYAKAASLVRAGKISWDELVMHGKALAKAKPWGHIRDHSINDWFLDKDGTGT